jgi:hypothetical protein
MSPEKTPITKEGFSNLSEGFFRAIDRRIDSVSRIRWGNANNHRTHGYYLTVNYGEESYHVGIDLTIPSTSDKETLVFRHQIANIHEGPEFEDGCQTIINWWEKEHPNSIFRMARARDKQRVLVGITIPAQLLGKSSTKTLIARLIDVIPEVEAKAKQISSSQTSS